VISNAQVATDRQSAARRLPLSAFSPTSDGNIRTVTLSYFRQVFRAGIRFRGGNGRITGVVR
jgi:hypothetical protein